MPWTTNLLVIANRTVDSHELLDAIAARAAAGPLRVTLVAPASDGPGSNVDRRRRTEARLDSAIDALDAAGVEVTGIVGDADPLLAVHDVWDPRRFDEVLVATLPVGASRWMASDLPRRIARLTGAKVTRVVAHDQTRETEPALA